MQHPALPTGAEKSLSRFDLRYLAFLAGLWLAMVALVNPVGDFPLNDDWVYGLSVKSLLEHGNFILPSANANFFAQAYWGALFCLPFGFSFTALRVSTSVLGLMGIAATFATARELGATSRTAAFAAALVAVNPIYFALANTFMTDVPFFAVSAASLYFLVRWAHRLDARDAIIGLVVSMIAILIRQAGIVLPLGFAVAYVVMRGVRPKAIALAALPVVAGAALHFGFQAWLHAAGRTPQTTEPPLMAMIAENLSHPLWIPLRLVIFCAYVGWFLLPLLAFASWRILSRSDSAQRRRLQALLGAAVAVAVAATFALGKPMPFLDNVMNTFGAGPLTLNDTFFLHANFPQAPPWLVTLWRVATAGALLGAGLLATVVAGGVGALRDRAPGRGDSVALLIVGCAGIAYALLAALALKFFYDRYVLFLLLPAALYAAWATSVAANGSASIRVVALAGVFLVLQAAYSAVATRDYVEWNRIRWAATTALMAEGVAQTAIDGGYEFNGWFNYDPNYRQPRGKSPWWVAGDEYAIASGPMPGYAIVRSYPFRRLLTGQDSRIVVLHRERP